MSESSEELKQTPLNELHKELGGKMVPFAGYEMPVQYSAGILTEHLHVREKAGLFDVSHMGQACLAGPDHETTAQALEGLTPGLFLSLKPGKMRYTLLMNDKGGIVDDLMVTRMSGDDQDGRLMLVVNAARKNVDYDYIRSNLPDNVSLITFDDRALLALQGPAAVTVMSKHCPEAAELGFMTAAKLNVGGIECGVSRSGYTGEDGFEISVANDKAEELARLLLADGDVLPIGLGARDSLRLEAGLCLYGHDIDETTSPVEADLLFALGKRRREAGDFRGGTEVQKQLADGISRKRVCLKLTGRAPAREGAEIQSTDGKTIGALTSGGYAPTVGGPIAMGYVASEHSDTGSKVHIIVRGKELEAEVVQSPFVPQRYYRKPS
ncbi:MAG: glycine cleavage system aminomethyltransferase GcvT [Methyloligellaceae bacterium]